MNDNRVLKATFWYTLSSFLLKGIGFLSAPIFARLLSKTEYGLFENFNAFLSIMTAIGTLSLSASLIRARFEFKESINAFVKTNLLLGFISTNLFFGIYFLLEKYIIGFLHLDRIYIVIVFASIAVSPALEMLILLLQFQYRYVLVSIINTVVAISSIATALLLVLTLQDKLFGRIIGGQIPLIVAGVIIFIFFLCKDGKINKKYFIYTLPICLPYIVHNLSGSLLNFSDRIMITGIIGSEDNAEYGMACAVAQISCVIWMAMNNAFFPWLSEQLNIKNYKEIYKFTKKYVLSFLLISLGIMLLSPEILIVLGGKKYLNSQFAVPPLIVGFLFLFLYSMYVNVEQFEKKTIGMAIGTIISALVNIILNMIFIPRYGYIVAAYTTMISYLIMLIIHYFLVRFLKLHICYNNKIIFLVALIGLLFGFGSLVTYRYFLLRLVVIISYVLLMIIFMYKNRKNIISFFKKTEGFINEKEK